MLCLCYIAHAVSMAPNHNIDRPSLGHSQVQLVSIRVPQYSGCHQSINNIIPIIIIPIIFFYIQYSKTIILLWVLVIFLPYQCYFYAKLMHNEFFSVHFWLLSLLYYLPLLFILLLLIIYLVRARCELWWVAQCSN